MKTISKFILEKLILKKDTLDDNSQKDRDPRDATSFEIGDILVSVYSYTMTIVTFYKVLERPTRTKFVLGKMKEKITSGDWQQGSCVPDEEHFDEKTCERFKFTLKRDNTLCVDKYTSAMCIWDGKPENFNHLD